jgi:hypothetical protein
VCGLIGAWQREQCAIVGGDVAIQRARRWRVRARDFFRLGTATETFFRI